MELRQAIPLNSILNARELGGYGTADGREIRRGVLLRTGSLHGISDADIRVLTDHYRLQHIIDLRMDMELPGAEDPAVGGAEHHHLNVIDTSMFFKEGMEDVDLSTLDPLKAAELTIRSGMQNPNMYIGFLKGETGKRAFADFFRILLAADPDRAVLWHCTSGKDRTGLAAMLLLTAFGVDEDVIIDDYLLTNTYNAPKIAATRRMLEEKGYDEDFIAQAVIVYAAVDERYMRNAIAFLKQEYGSVCGYISDGLGVTQKDINEIKDKYLI